MIVIIVSLYSALQILCSVRYKQLIIIIIMFAKDRTKHDTSNLGMSLNCWRVAGPLLFVRFTSIMGYVASPNFLFWTHKICSSL